MCPEGGSHNVKVRSYDFGRCPQTGYHDVGEYFECRDCGAEGDVREIACVGNVYA
jgi:hypothetical protein